MECFGTKNKTIQEVVLGKTNAGFPIKKKTMAKKFLRRILFAISIILFALSFAAAVFYAYGNLEARSFLEEQGFTDIKIGVCLAKDRCYPSQYFRYRFEATYPNINEKVAGEVCGGSTAEEWFSGCSPPGHFAQMHKERKEAVIKSVCVAIFTQLAVFLLLILARKE
jgi:hypothetical protein